jgi:cysteine sulfinate desulfinase/cysteine desulfurase-like protein
MIVGLGKAAELVSKNLKQYEKHMRNMRDYLENSLMVCLVIVRHIHTFKNHKNIHFEGNIWKRKYCN